MEILKRRAIIGKLIVTATSQWVEITWGQIENEVIEVFTTTSVDHQTLYSSWYKVGLLHPKIY